MHPISIAQKKHYFNKIGQRARAGPPQLMMSFSDDSQIDWNLLDNRDRRYGTSTMDLREHRQAAVKRPEPKAQGADIWEESGRSFQTRLDEVELKHMRNR